MTDEELQDYLEHTLPQKIVDGELTFEEAEVKVIALELHPTDEEAYLNELRETYRTERT